MVRLRMLALGAAAVVLSFTTSVPVAAQTWREVKTDNFTIVSDASEGRARRIVWQFEQLRAALPQGFPWMQVSLDRPVVILAVRNEDSMRAVAPELWERRGPRPGSVFVAGADRHYIMLRTDLEVEDQLMNPFNNAYRAYSSLVLSQGAGRRLPMWLTNGLAVMLSNTIVRSREIVFGRPMPWVLEVAKDGPRMPLQEFLAVTASSPAIRGAVARERFDAQSWAVLHYILYGNRDRAASRERFDRLIDLLIEGRSSEEALTEVYGNLAAFDDAYTLFISQPIATHEATPTDRAIVEGKLPARVLSVPEHAAVRAAFHVAMGRPVEAREVAATAIKADAASAVPDDIDGMVKDYEQNSAGAIEAFAKAAAAGSTNYWTYYRLAALRSNAGLGGEGETDALLERATALEPTFAPAYATLAASRINRGEIEPAIGAARRAVELDPGTLSHRTLLVRVLTRATQNEEAIKVAREAMALARTPQERENLEALIEAAQR